MKDRSEMDAAACRERPRDRKTLGDTGASQPGRLDNGEMV